MKVFTDLASIPAMKRVVTIGKFDGIHLGHQALIARVRELADAQGLPSTLVTFDRNPAAVLAGETARPNLIGPTQKARLVEAAGIDEIIELSFDNSLATESAEHFVARVLVQALQTEILVVGEDFKFGHKGTGDVKLLEALSEQFGYQLVVMAPVLAGGSAISSTRIRTLLEEGNVTGAAELLGRYHATTGMVEHGLKIGRQLGFPTANISREAEGYLPRDAVYAGWLEDGGKRYPAALSVGVNETIQTVPKLVEAHIIDGKGLDLYDREVTVEYVDFIRPAKKFDSVESLIVAIEHDLVIIRKLLNSANSQ